jgi:hypothetical protein
MAYELLTAEKNLPKIKQVEYVSNVPEQETLKDFALIKKLMQCATYEIPEHRRNKLIEKICNTLDTDLSPQQLISITNLVLRMDEHNLKMVSLAIPKKITTTSTHTNARSMSDEALLDAVREVVKKLPPTSQAQLE